jgi:hypothetical protein
MRAELLTAATRPEFKKDPGEGGNGPGLRPYPVGVRLACVRQLGRATPGNAHRIEATA